MDDHARVNILGHGFRAEPANFDQHTTAEQAAASRKERTIVPIAASLKDTIEQRLFILEHSIKLKILLKHVRVVKMMRRLNKRHLLILEKSHCILQETSGRNVIEIKDRDDFSQGLLQGMIQISRFRMFPVRTRDVSTV